jgi:hypothetical protein
MTVRRTIATLGTTAVMLLSTAACSSGDDANRTACDDFDAAYGQLGQDVDAAGTDQEAVAAAYGDVAGPFDEIAAREDIDEALADQIEASAEAARDTAESDDPNVTETDMVMRQTFDVCDDLLGG